MLPANHRTKISKVGNSLEFRPFLGGIYQHLYLTSDEEIKEKFEGWCIDDEGNIRNGMSDLHTLSLSKKIIATTDESLLVEDINNPYDYRSKTGYEPHSLPRPSNEFLKAYCKSINKDEVYVELECTHSDHAPNGLDCGLKLSNKNEVTVICAEERVKSFYETYINQEKPQLYTREQVIKAIHDCMLVANSTDNIGRLQKFIDDWADKNLK